MRLIVEEGIWWIHLVSVWKDGEDLELPVDRADVDFFDLGTKLCQISIQFGKECGR